MEKATHHARPQERPHLTGRFFSMAGRSFHVLTRGKGRPIVLLHGNGSLGEEILSAFPEVEGVCWIAPDRPGFGQSEPLPEGRQDPVSQAAWLQDLIAAMGLGPVTLVAHSLAAGAALAFASARPDSVDHLVLLAPFCRPTPERPLLALRLTTVPFVGPFVRRVIVPLLVRSFRKRLVHGFTAPNPPPPWLKEFPVRHAANPRAIEATVAELFSFNAGMQQIEAQLHLTVPVTVVHGLSDTTAEPEWHLPWLRQRAGDMKCVLLLGCGHAVHHAAPDIVRDIVLNDEVPEPLSLPPVVQSASRQASRITRQTRHPDESEGFVNLLGVVIV